MQDNTHEHIDDALVQRGWQAMQQQLDVALPVQPQRKRRVLAWWWIAAAAALLLLVAGYGWWTGTPAQQPDLVPTQLPSAKATAKTPQLPTAPAVATPTLETTTTVRGGIRATQSSVPPAPVFRNRATDVVPIAALRPSGQLESSYVSAVAPALIAESPTLSNAATSPLAAAPMALLLVPSASADMTPVPAVRATRPWHGYVALAGGLDPATQRPLAALSAGLARQWRSGWGLDAAVGYQRHITTFKQDTDDLRLASLDGMTSGGGLNNVVVIDGASLRYSRVQASLAATYRILPRVQVGLGVQGSRYLTAAVDAQYPVSMEIPSGTGNFSEIRQNGSLDLFENTENEFQYNLDPAGVPLDAPTERWSAGMVGDVSVRINTQVSVQLQYQHTLTNWPFAAQRGQALLLGVKYSW